MLNEWGTLESEITEDFPIESVILQRLLIEKNDDNEDNETHIERVRRLEAYIAARMMQGPIEFQRIGDREFVRENRGTELWLMVEDDEVMNRWEETKAKREGRGRTEKVCKKTTEAKGEEERHRSTPRPGSCCCTKRSQGSGRPRNHAAATSAGAGAGRDSQAPTPGDVPTPRPTVNLSLIHI